jgi:hypothetical protein
MPGGFTSILLSVLLRLGVFLGVGVWLAGWGRAAGNTPPQPLLFNVLLRAKNKRNCYFRLRLVGGELPFFNMIDDILLETAVF